MRDITGNPAVGRAPAAGVDENPAAASGSRTGREPPEHVLLWSEAVQLSPLMRLVPRNRRPGEWRLITFSDYEAGYFCPAIADWETSAGHELTASLAYRVTSHLGYPVRPAHNPTRAPRRADERTA